MDTSSEHIIIHKQTIEDKVYIRIIACGDTSSYYHEIGATYKTCVVDSACIFYNCADCYQRLLHDLDFKRFKGYDISKVSQGLWFVNNVNNLDICDWFQNVYIQWIRNKLTSYKDDTDIDQYYEISKDVDWNEIERLGYSSLTLGDKECTYVLNEREYFPNDSKLVLSKTHLLSLVYNFVKYNYFDVMTDNHNMGPINKIIHGSDLLIRGVCISKSELTKDEVYHVLTYLGVTNDMLKTIASSTQFLKPMYDEDFHLYNVQPSEFNPFKTWYSFLITENNNTQIMYADHANTFDIYNNKKLNSQQELKRILCKNLITGTVVVVEKEFKYLHEFQNLSKFVYTTNILTTFIDLLNNTTITKTIIEELKQLLEILPSFAENDKLEADKPQSLAYESLPYDNDGRCVNQVFLTQHYVNLHKNDSVETLASVAIDNIHQYLTDHMDKALINKNLIGKDLVNLGVRKTRKAKGYVYGIDDTSKTGIRQI